MNLENILATFVVFIFIGWIIEVAYRSYQAKNIVNPGFLSGPYVPIYGFGGLVTYFISFHSEELSLFRSAFFFILAIAFLEYFTGLFFQKIFKVRLWDYSDERLNLNSHICPKFLFYWFVLGAVFRYFLFPYFDYLVREVVVSGVGLFTLGFFYGVFAVDLIISFNLAYRARKTINAFGENYISGRVLTLKGLYREVSSNLNQRVDTSGFKKRGSYFLNYFRLKRNIKEELEEAIKEKIEKIRDNNF